MASAVVHYFHMLIRVGNDSKWVLIFTCGRRVAKVLTQQRSAMLSCHQRTGERDTGSHNLVFSVMKN